MVKTYTINLQQSYEDRWRSIVKDHKEYLLQLKNYIDVTIYNLFLSIYITNANIKWFIIFFCKLATWTLSWFIECPHWKEIKTLSRLMDIDFYYLLWMQYFYEFNACGGTTIVLEKNSNVYVFSTMDWDLDLLKYITIEIEVYQGAKHLYSATTWIGYTGILRGIKQIQNENIALLVNYRGFTTPSFYQLVDLIFYQYSWSTSVLLRDILEKETNYEKIAKRVMLSTVFSPTYIVMASNHISHCCNVIREPKSYILQVPCSFNNNYKPFLVITSNYDNDKNNDQNNECYRQCYRQCVDTCSMLIKGGTFNLSLNELADIFLRGNVLNYTTIYALVVNLNQFEYNTIVVLPVDEKV